MQLAERYRRLTLWNKIAVWGALASLLGLLITLIFALHPLQPKTTTRKSGADSFLGNYVVPEPYTRWSIEKLHLPANDKRDILRVLEFFEHKDYSSARRVLQQLRDTDPFVRRFKRDFDTAILFGERKYRAALESILTQYEGLPLTDVRYRWELAYVIYFFRRDRGLRECERCITELSEKYGRSDISYVWMAIHPKALMRLLSYDLYPNQELHETQLDILKYVVKKHPEDAFVDHAYYFLHDYEQIIRQYPKSMILDRVYYARAYLRFYKEVLQAEGPLSRNSLLEIADLFADFIRRYPATPLTSQAYGKQADCYLSLDDSTESITKLCDLLRSTGMPASEFVSSEQRREYASTVRYRIYLYFSAHPAKVGDEAYRYVADRHLPDIDFDEMAYAIGMKAFQEGNYALSLRYYSRLSKERRKETRIARRIAALEHIGRVTAPVDSREYLLEMALALKSTVNDADRALPYLDRYLELYPQDEAVPSVLVLQAFCYRDAKKGKDMLRKYYEFLSRFPGDHLADDVQAEIGLYYLLWEDSPVMARSMFEKVIRVYPAGNAVDNCYNWIAWSYLQEKNYGAALSAYAKVVEMFPGTRFAKYARKNIPKIRDLSN